MGQDGTNGFKGVLVVDADRQFVEYVKPAVARRALKDGAATVFRKQPFSIQLPPGVHRCPKTFAKAKRTRKEKGKMTLNTDFNKIFEQEKSVWVQSLVPGQVSLEFKDAMGNITGVVVPFSGDPINLTDHVAIEAIQRSTDLRKLCNPRRQPSGGYRPAALKLMTEEDAYDHFRRKAERRKIYKRDTQGNVVTDVDGNPELDVEAASRPKVTMPAVAPSQTRVDDTRSATREALEASDGISSVKDQPVMMAQAITPRVLQLCHEASVAETDNERPLASDMIDEFESLPLSEDDLNHILAAGYYKSVKKWSQERLAETLNSED